VLRVTCWPVPSGGWGLELTRPSDAALLCRATMRCVP
jgi:hypothetical protein